MTEGEAGGGPGKVAHGGHGGLPERTAEPPCPTPELQGLPPDDPLPLLQGPAS